MSEATQEAQVSLDPREGRSFTERRLQDYLVELAYVAWSEENYAASWMADPQAHMGEFYAWLKQGIKDVAGSFDLMEYAEAGALRSAFSRAVRELADEEATENGTARHFWAAHLTGDDTAACGQDPRAEGTFITDIPAQTTCTACKARKDINWSMPLSYRRPNEARPFA